MAIISIFLVLYGSVAKANCSWLDSFCTVLGFNGLLLAASLYLNPWAYPTWALISTTAGIFCFLVAIVHESWDIDTESYEATGKAAIVMGIIFFVISIIEYLTPLYLTRMFPVVW